MKKLGVLMEEAGFNKNAPDSVKEAFLKHLIKASTGVSVPTPSEKKEMAEHPEKVVHFKGAQQLSFDFGKEESVPAKKKASTF
jgi:hypothetical protein